MLTIDEMIVALERARVASPLRGKTVVYICVQDIPYVEVSAVKLDKDEDGAVALIMPIGI